MKTLIYGTNHKIVFDISRYTYNGNLYIGLVSNGKPWQDLTINFCEKCKENCAFIDINNNGNEIVDWLKTNNLGKPTGRKVGNGYPEFEFNMEKLMQYAEEKEDKLKEHAIRYWTNPIGDSMRDGYNEFNIKKGDNGNEN